MQHEDPYRALFQALADESRHAQTQVDAAFDHQRQNYHHSFHQERDRLLKQAVSFRQAFNRVDDLVEQLKEEVKYQQDVQQRQLSQFNVTIESLQAAWEASSQQNRRQQQETQQKQTQLQATSDQLKRQLQEKNAALEQERARVQQLQSSESNARTRLGSALSRILPQLQSALDMYEQDEQLSTRVVRLQPPAESPASDALTTHQDVTRRNLQQREAILTCPISLDLFDDPVTTACCGKTFSSEPLHHAMARNLQCPVCRSRNITSIRNRDMAALVELHRSESAVLGVSEESTASEAAAASNSAPEAAATAPSPATTTPPAASPTTPATSNRSVEQDSNPPNRRNQRGRRGNRGPNARRGGRYRGNRQRQDRRARSNPYSSPSAPPSATNTTSSADFSELPYGYPWPPY
ncbi:hypothetical protein PHYBOEH_011925 [Phytophthora boehmeriae]|uniref:SP-RING-type domain-containing protein n=1 Tax=Phytophthora boehmeriae TaxID=109152 RepID=A0A8T1VED5_9STRA|nr:hypothetical protein PHYBOEH_011925 [Phytophthora boehmeriae]